MKLCRAIGLVIRVGERLRRVLDDGLYVLRELERSTDCHGGACKVCGQPIVSTQVICGLCDQDWSQIRAKQWGRS